MPGNPAPTELQIQQEAPAHFVSVLRGLIGDPYQYGAAGPTAFDCSGLVQYGLEQIGMANVPRTSEAQWKWIKESGGQINKGQLKPGDLVFSQWPGDNASPGHVQVYVGGGKVIQAPHPGGSVSVASLSSDTGHIVGYGRIPFSGRAIFENRVTQSVQGSDVGGLIGEAGTLLHGISEMLDWAFSLFAPGQGWRIAFGAASVATGYGAVKAYMASGPEGAGFPLAVGLAGASALSAFMALRSWPQLAGGPEKPGAYVAEILEGQPPPPGPKRVKETGQIEAGLAVFAVAWLAQKAASGINSIVTAITGALSGLGLIALAA